MAVWEWTQLMVSCPLVASAESWRCSQVAAVPVIVCTRVVFPTTVVCVEFWADVAVALPGAEETVAFATELATPEAVVLATWASEVDARAS